MYHIDLNCDLGESFGAYRMGMDEEVLPYISSANIACGFHASDPLTMERSVRLAVSHGVAVGAHPGFPDLVGFGRRNLAASPREVKAMVQYQIGALDAFCRAAGTRLHHVKPHGALYNMAARDEALAMSIAEAIAEIDPDLILLSLAGSRMTEAGKKLGLRTANEVFADRAYEEDGTLVARSREGAMISSGPAAIERVIQIIRSGTVTAITGKSISLHADSVCVHGDGPAALEFVRSLRKAFADAGIEVSAR